jgi:putative ABC transport system permease protein
LLLIGFGSPYLMMLSQTNPIRVLRRDISPTSWSSIAVTLLAVIAITAILMIETKAFTLSASIVVGALLFFTPLYQALTLLLIKIRMHNHSFLLRILLRDPKSLLIQIFSIAIALTALLAVFSLRGELLSAWTTKIPADSPNQFAVNIAPTEVEPFLSALRESNIKTRDVFPIVRGRLTRLNQEPVKEIDRELNLTWQSLPTKDLTLIAGIWWKPNEACQCVSIENSLAERIGIKIGDKLKFDMAEGAILVTVKSIRKVDWNSLQPNFYFIFPPGVIDQFPYTALTSFHIDKNKYHTMARLAQQFPTIVFLDITAMLDSFTSIIQQTAKAVELVLLLTLLGSLLVIISQVVASIDQRRLESALLRVIGISRQKLQQRLFLEFMSIGVAAGLLAAFTNEILAAFIYWKLLELPITLHPLLWWQAPLAGACLTLFSGWLSLRCTWASSPMITLRTP